TKVGNIICVISDSVFPTVSMGFKVIGAFVIPILIVLLLDDVSALSFSPPACGFPPVELQAAKASMDTIHTKPKIVFPFFCTPISYPPFDYPFTSFNKLLAKDEKLAPLRPIYG